MTHRHYVTVHGQRIHLDPLLAQAHPSVTRPILAKRLALGWPLARALSLPCVRRGPQHSFVRAVERYLLSQGTTP